MRGIAAPRGCGRSTGPFGPFGRADRLRQHMALFALVQPGLAAASQLGAFKPVEHEQRSLDLADLLERDVDLVRPLVGCELPQHGRRRDVPGLERGDQREHLVPVFADDVDPDSLAEQGGDRGVVGERRDRREAMIGEVPQSRA